jgi:acetyl-CoA synthetase
VQIHAIAIKPTGNAKMDETTQSDATVRIGVSHTALERMVFAGLHGAGMNACVACCDRWADGSRIGLEWFRGDGSQTVRTYDALRDDAARFANVLTARGVQPGDVVAAMLPRGAESLTVILGTWRAGAVYQPISTGCPRQAVEARIFHTGHAAAKLIVTDTRNRGKFDLVDFCPPVLMVSGGAVVRPGDGDMVGEMSRQSANFAPVPRDGDDPFILLAGGRRCPVMAKLRSLVAVLTSIQLGLDPDEAAIGWDVADPVWCCGLYFSVIRPLLPGKTATARESDSTMFNHEVCQVMRARATDPVRTVRGFRPTTELRLAA